MAFEPYKELGLCGHCGGQHPEDECGVKDATRRILENYVPRGMTTGKDCPNCGRDGTFHWGPESKTFVCECGHEVPTSHGRETRQ